MVRGRQGSGPAVRDAYMQVAHDEGGGSQAAKFRATLAKIAGAGLETLDDLPHAVG